MQKRAPKKAVSAEMATMAAELGMSLKAGKVTAVRDRYMLTIGKVKKPIAVGEIIAPRDMKKLAGQDVIAAVSGATITAIRRLGPRFPWILCYIPVPDWIRTVSPELRNVVIQKYRQEGIISEQFAKELRAR